MAKAPEQRKRDEELTTLGRELGGNGYGEYLLQLAEETGPPAPAVAMTDDSV